MTPLHKGFSKPVRGAGGEEAADKKVAVNTLTNDREQVPRLLNDGSRPLKTKKRARRRQKSRSAGLNDQIHHGNSDDGVKANSPLVQNGSHAPSAVYDGKANAANGKKRRRKRSAFVRANQNLQPPIMHGGTHHDGKVLDDKGLVEKRPAEKGFVDRVHGNKGAPSAAQKDRSPLKKTEEILAYNDGNHANGCGANKTNGQTAGHERRYRKFHLKRHNGKHTTSRSRGFEKQVGLLGVDDALIEGSKADAISQNSFAKPARHNGLYAALDLGTNNCRLLIASPTRPGYFRVIDAFSRIVRLGEGLGRHNRLSEAAMARAIEALKVCATKLSQCNISHQRLIATEACRSAENGAEFIARVKIETGLDLEIVNRETEARLAVSGCGTLVEPETEAIVLFDIGGGSSEIALIDVSHRRSPRLADHIIAWTSLPVGVVTLAERFGGISVSSDDFLAMKNHVSDLLKNFHDRKKLGSLVNSQGFHLLGTSGTVTTLAGIHLKLERYDRRRIDGMWMQSTEVDKMTEKLLSWNMSERVANPCIGADRADLVLAGCAILEAIREIWPSGRLRVADRGLREGILTELMSHSGAWRKNRFARRQNHYDKVHNK